jgi:sulfite reductase alpha subunit-like flavoprotein
MTIWEEGTELIGRVRNNGVLPMFTSCCPAWINFVEKIHPELIPNLSTAKSPHMMLGAAVKSYFAERKGLDAKDLFVVSLMPCTAKKDEVKRGQMLGDVDAVLTVREFCRLVELFGLDWGSLPDEPFDRLMGESTGAAALFGVTGGVMEAAVRFAHEKLTGEKLGKVEYQQWRGFKSVKNATIRIAGIELRVAVCNGIAHARELVETGNYRQYHFIEVMACPYGCISGGGQPILTTRAQAAQRARAIYEIDHQMRGKVTSLDNTEIAEMYRTFMGEPNGPLAHRLLHTHYQRQITPTLEMKQTMEKMPIVAYGSASGNAAKLARQLAGYIETAPVSLNACGLAKMLKKRTAIIVLSTFGDGEVPSNATKFVDQLEANAESLTDLTYAICALGSHEYPKFVAAARRVDALLGRMGAQRLLPTVDLDASSPDKGEGVFEAWVPRVVTSLGLTMPEIRITPQYTITTGSPEDPVSTEALVPLGFGWGVLVSSTVLTPEKFEPQMHRYSIKLPRAMTYAAGDHVAILPQNDEAVVGAVLTQLGLDATAVLEINTELPEGINTIPSKVTVKQLFSQYLDLNGVPTRNLIRVFRQFCTDRFTQEQLSKLLDPSEPRAFDDMMNDTNIGEFIQEHAPHGAPPLEFLVTACPLIKPRLYSIASAPSAAARNIDLVITDNYFGPHNARKGLCTSFLRRFGLTRVALRTQPGCFGYPEDPSTPIVMAALGCGVAPMLSLLQHRENLAGEIGSAALFFGCRFKNTYPILDSMLQNYVETGAMQDLYIAYSREGNSKTYITDLMRNNADDVWRYWSNPKCEYFYCGPARGIPDQLHAILVQITMDRGRMSRDEAEAFCGAHPHHVESF